ncbi:MAG: S24/S26 family peptidase [Deltaproteobacteria bacterium]|nr:S24/S26 family peptidase [Deltaproteobacteria bacterium]
MPKLQYDQQFKNVPPSCLYSVPGGVLSLSGPALQEFLRAVLSRGASFRFKARGFSMHPFIQDGDNLTIIPVKGGKLRCGQVAAFCHPETGKLVVHRLLCRRPGGVLVRGDNIPDADGLIRPADVLGLVTRVERQGRAVLLGLGPERRLIAWLSRHNLLKPVIFRAGQLLRPWRRTLV